MSSEDSPGSHDPSEEDTATDTPPAVTAAAEIDAAGDPPTFEVDPGSHSFYHLEVATRAELFQDDAHGSERDDSNYFASWDDGPFLSVSGYRLPDDAWANLNHAEQLFYRAWSSASDTDWSDPLVSVADDDFADAPSVRITGGSSGDEPVDKNVVGAPISGRRQARSVPPQRVSRGQDAPAVSAAPVIAAAETLSRSDDAPVFRIEPQRWPQYHVEVATDAALFDAARRARTPSPVDYFSSAGQRVAEGVSATTYTLPNAVWQAMRRASRLYYRVVGGTAGDAAGQASTPDAEAAMAPWILLTDGRAVRDGVTATGHDEQLWLRK
jgi:hypothetical protein